MHFTPASYYYHHHKHIFRVIEEEHKDTMYIGPNDLIVTIAGGNRGNVYKFQINQIDDRNILK